MMNAAEFANIANAEDGFWWYRGMRKIMFRLLDPLAGQRRLERVLDAGCGTGHFALQLERRYGWRMVPLDLGWEGLQYGRALGAERLVQGDVAALPFPAASFDAAVSMDVLVHFPRGLEQPAFDELARVVRPGGLVILRVAALDLLKSRHSMFAGERQRFTRSRLTEAVTRAGIRVLRADYANSILLPVALARFRVWEPLIRQPPRSGVLPAPPWLDRMLYSALALESRWLGAGHGFPAGQSLILIGEKSPVP